ncbi:CdaR family transcriptional regulator [Amycolatopsis sp. YIM 10]|uniref:PucR family transcriptional regulator n=1 Tax=Amycolatopsis sp. YIM 10 TaxID=2653857 RepID=UPI001290763C|nr:helix-turn-helix domain-containing protein [Amycolatopsis sp. YIM 10]QFU87371.1 Carbohydrate diacid regulator [Amycolatopsis sp. YIM 10]
MRTSLARVLDSLGGTLLELLAGDPAGPVGDVILHDPLADRVPDRALVLGIGADDLPALVRRLATRRAAGLVVRLPVEVDSDLRAALDETGLVLLGLRPGASWDQVFQLLLSGDAPPDGDDLFALADAICALVDAPITIEAPDTRVLAFSGRQEESDRIRIEVILGRRTPEPYLGQDDVHARLARDDRPFMVPAITEDTLPRTVVAVRAGGELLGSIWAAAREPLSPDQEQAFTDAAKLVALHLLRLRASADTGRRLTAELVAGALEGRPGAAARLGLEGTNSVLAMGFTEDGGPDTASLTAYRQQAADTLALHLSTVLPGSAVTLLERVVYAIVPTTGDRALQLATEFLQRTRSRVDGLIGIGDAEGLPRSRADADRALRVLRSAHTQRTVARAADVEVEALLLDLRDLSAAQGRGPAGPLARLFAYDQAKGGSLVESLRAWLDAHGDVAAASAAVHVHENTFRYRLRRIAEVGEFDLGDPDARFAANLQLRVFTAG